MEFNPGFRLSLLDFAVLITGCTGALFLFQPLPLAGLVVLFVVGHFFLFCNVLRMPRVPELIWSATFVGLAVGALQFAFPPWWLTLVLGFFESRKPSYHGLFWRQLNPALPQWFSDACGGHDDA